MEKTERLSTTVSLLAKRVGSVAAEVERAMSAKLAVGRDVATCNRWITTGAGTSEGPARLLAALLRSEGVNADFAPISSFVAGAPAGDVCVVVSQRLSPNARVPLMRSDAYEHVLLVTSIEEDAEVEARGVRIVAHGPREEDGLLLRVVGPAAANATVIRLAGEVGAARRQNGGATFPVNFGDVMRTSLERASCEAIASRIEPHAMFDVVGLVATGADVALCDGLRHKILEGLGRTHPPIWDTCALVHGPLQSFYERTATLVLLERESAPSELTARLMQVLDGERHRVIRLRSPLPGPLALLDFDLQLDHFVLEALRARPRDLVDWPGKGCDAPLYELGKDARI